MSETRKSKQTDEMKKLRKAILEWNEGLCEPEKTKIEFGFFKSEYQTKALMITRAFISIQLLM